MKFRFLAILEEYILSSNAKCFDDLSLFKRDMLIIALLHDPRLTDPADFRTLGELLPKLLREHYRDKIGATKVIETLMREAEKYFHFYLDRKFNEVRKQLLINGAIK